MLGITCLGFQLRVEGARPLDQWKLLVQLFVPFTGSYSLNFRAILGGNFCLNLNSWPFLP